MAGLTRRQFIPLLGATAALATVAPRAFADNDNSSKSRRRARFVYVGTYTAPDVPPGGTHPEHCALGIYVFRLDPSDGGLTPVQIVPASNPSFVALDPDADSPLFGQRRSRRARERVRDQPGDRER